MTNRSVSRNIFIALAFVATGLQVAYSEPLGKPRPAAHEISFEELLANARFFDGQPVRLIGVSALSVEFEARPKLYFSLEAFANRTYQYLDVELAEEWEPYEQELESLRGQYAIVEGIFHYEAPEKIDVADQRGQICIPTCPTSGWLSDVNFVDERAQR